MKQENTVYDPQGSYDVSPYEINNEFQNTNSGHFERGNGDLFKENKEDSFKEKEVNGITFA